MSLLKQAQRQVSILKTHANLNAFISHAEPSGVLAQVAELEARADASSTGLTSGGTPQCDPQHPPLNNNNGHNASVKPPYGRLLALKDNICTSSLPTTAASRMLGSFTSPFDATVAKILKEAGAVVVGKTNMDEFGMGSHGLHSFAGAAMLRGHGGDEYSAGGSSGGSAVAVRRGMCWAALGTDTGGSVRLPAAYTGIVGFKPSYGLLSRWGVIAYANSLDTVGILGKNVEDVRALFDTLNVPDPQDPTSLPFSSRERLQRSRRKPTTSSLKIGIPLDYNISTLSAPVLAAWIASLQHLQSLGHSLHPVRLPSTQHALPAYYNLAPAEASSNLAKFDGVRYGTRSSSISTPSTSSPSSSSSSSLDPSTTPDGTPTSVLYALTRGTNLGAEVQRRILLGAFSLSADAMHNYFIQAQKVRRLVQRDFDAVFRSSNPLLSSSLDEAGDVEGVENEGYDVEAGVDVLVCPTAPTLAPRLKDARRQTEVEAYMNDVFTVPASLAGLPAVSVPVPAGVATEGLEGEVDGQEGGSSVGMQIMGQFGDDRLVLDVGKMLMSRGP